MKIKTVISGCLICIVVLFVVHEFSIAQPTAPAPTSKIGLISVPRTLAECKATATFGVKAKAENDRMAAEENKISAEIKVLSDELRSGVFLPESSDYLSRYRTLLQKQGELKALQEFNAPQRTSTQRRWAEKIYKEVLRITEEVAAKKGLDIVLQRSKPEFPIRSADQLMMTLSTHKVLYGGGCVDITNEVIAELDKIESTLVE